ncbi:hypothetical protein HP548_00495 [Paenibacillus taichungensis]|uniref:Uncharacterized protein n=1 Tax=Paenibacillus taichungensis TaxID=484184 RepID=A0ABX2MID3_9BACL|nr:hypothetical protein [Paenibacillus taichungensis]NUU52600.1 hypothetical protein [Paenibacillus taichungensis]
MSSNMVTTEKCWVWTEKAVSINSYGKSVGSPVWDRYRKEAPAHWLKDGLIEEAGQETFPAGQAAFDF